MSFVTGNVLVSGENGSSSHGYKRQIFDSNTNPKRLCSNKPKMLRFNSTFTLWFPLTPNEMPVAYHSQSEVRSLQGERLEQDVDSLASVASFLMPSLYHRDEGSSTPSPSRLYTIDVDFVACFPDDVHQVPYVQDQWVDIALLRSTETLPTHNPHCFTSAC